MEFRDYYETMGVTRTASADEIKKIYRRLARKYHPDVSKEPNAEAKFKEVQEAYEVLRDPEKRAAYDQLGNEVKSGQDFRPPPDWASGFEFRGRPQSQARHGADSQFSDFFSSLFGDGGAFSQAGEGPRRSGGRDHHARVDIDLEEAFRGGARSLTLRRSAQRSDGSIELRNHEVKVMIPAGLTDGQQMRLSGQGEPAQGEGRAGDLYLEVHIRPHALFQLDGRDVTVILPIAPWEAALGGAVTVPTLGGPVQMRIPEQARAGQKLRLRGRGLPGDPPGDEYLQLSIVLPPADSPKARAFYEQMSRELAFNPRANFGSQT
jgi:curved DNA-binding protein